MPIIKSAKKRVRVAKKATVRNVKTKRNLKSAVKTFQSSLAGSGAKAADAHSKAQSALDKAGKKGVMHKNKVARKKRQLAAAAKASGVKLSGSKKTAVAPKKSTPTKKPVAKKSSTIKKPAAKKSAKK